MLVFRVSHVITPGGIALADGKVGHEAVGCGAVPMPLVGGGEDDLSGPQWGDGLSAGLDPSLAFGHIESLANRVSVLGGAGAGREMHKSDAGRCVAVTLGDRVDVHVAGEPLGRAFDGRTLGLGFHIPSFPFSSAQDCGRSSALMARRSSIAR